MGSRTLLMVGTVKGGFLLESDAKRSEWTVRGPFCSGWDVPDMAYDPATGAIYAASYEQRWPETIPAVWKSTDLGQTWTHARAGLTYGEAGPALQKLWHLKLAHGALYAGAEPAGLFRSHDGGQTWTHVRGLRAHPTCPNWAPGNGGLCLHSIVDHPTDPNQLWVGISSAGIFHTADGGETWEPRVRGIRDPYGFNPDPSWGGCVHKLVRAPGQDLLLYNQFHWGVYRSHDGAATWEEITAGLPSDFGFPIAVHPRDPQTIYVIPLHDEGRTMPGGSTAVWRSRDGGSTWQRLEHGLPQSMAYFNVLREGLAVDSHENAGVYFGTNTGQIFASPDAGDSWRMIADFLPRILSVNAAVVDAA